MDFKFVNLLTNTYKIAIHSICFTKMNQQFLQINQHYAGKNIQGKRNYQEDDFGFDNSKPAGLLITLADGMGGHKGGATASSCTIQTFMRTYRAMSGKVAVCLGQSLQQANQQLVLETNKQPALAGMGCTFVGVVIKAGQLEWISIGDSPLWVYRAGRLYRLNADHSMKPILQEQVRRGDLTPKAAETHWNRNMLRSALTGTRLDLVDQSHEPFRLCSGDRVLLASDGIFTLSDLEISKILAQPLSAKKTVDLLLKAVQDKAKPTQDNTTALVVKIPNEVKAIPSASRRQTKILLPVAILIVLSLIFWAHLRIVDVTELIARFF